MFCAVDGKFDVYIVPHVNRQEVYAGKRMNESIYNENYYGGGSKVTFID